MQISDADRPFFLPAETVPEALGRIYAITGVPPQGRGEKRALVALRDSLGVDVDIVRTNDDMAARLAARLDIAWEPTRYAVRHRITLDGLNALLEGATEAYRQGSLRRSRAAAAAALQGPAWRGFEPAVSKIEAVTRIAGLTGSPREWLGPGSKEHKSVLVNLADRLLPEDHLDRSSKTRMARDIAEALGALWSDSCYSTGETISLEGLNTILAGAERRLGRLGTTAADLLMSPEAEADAFVAALVDGLDPGPWDARRCVTWMDRNEVRGANDNEWQGWYFEARGREVLNNAFAPRRDPVRRRFGNTDFDYAMNHVWDLKAHTAEQYLPVSGRTASGRPSLILNDAEAIRSCADAGGIGFLVLSGRAVMDEDGCFVSWHREFKARRGAAPAVSNSGRSRMRKAGFQPLRVDAYWLGDGTALDAALAAGRLSVSTQGRQAPRSAGARGRERRDKMQLHRAAASEMVCASQSWREGSNGG
ncbi:MAG: hypothetical protein WA966_03165 [Ornithinimicrobium sp.]